MDRLYNGCSCSECKGEKSEEEQKKIEEETSIYILSSDDMEEVLRQIYYGEFNPKNDIQRILYDHTLKFLNEAVDRNFTVTYEQNKEFIEELKYNNSVFAAFKTHKQQNDIAALLLDEDNKLRSFAEFKKLSEPIIGKYNVAWLESEHNTAVIRARIAELFRRFAKEKDVFPNLEWIPSTSVEIRLVHQQYYNQIRSLDDEWWLTNYPGNMWNCKCSVDNTNEEITHVGYNLATQKEREESVSNAIPNYKVVPGLDKNPAFTGSLFTPTHPYISLAYDGAKKAVKKFMEELYGKK